MDFPTTFMIVQYPRRHTKNQINYLALNNLPIHPQKISIKYFVNQN